MDEDTAPAAEKKRAGLIYISFDDHDESLAPEGESSTTATTVTTPPRRLQERLKLAKYQHKVSTELRRHLQICVPEPSAEQGQQDGLWVDWTSLPDEIVWQVFSYLDVWSLIQVGQSSKTWRRISQDQYIGTTLDFSKFKAHLQDEHFTLILESIHAPRLKTINLHGCSSVTARAIARIPDQCPSLTSLLLSGCLAVNNFAVYSLLTKESNTASEQKPPVRLTNRRDIRQWHLAQLNQWNRGDWRPMTSLTVLRLSYCSHVSDKALEWILRCCPNLEELYLSGCPRITDQSCQLLAAKSTVHQLQPKSPTGAKGKAAVIVTTARVGVRVLDLTGCYRITVQGLVTMLSSLTTLTTLYAPPCLGQWDAFTDARLWLDSALAFPHLEVLHLSGMAVKEDTITETLPKRLANLVALDLSGSKIISSRPECPGGGNGGGGADDDGLDWTDDGGGDGHDADNDNEADRRDQRRTEDAWAGMLATMPHLREVNLRACTGVRHDVLADLQAAFPLIRLSF